MRDHYDEFTERGADVTAIGMGWPEMAAHFKKEFDVPFPLLVDHTKQTYRALDMKRSGAWNIYGPPVWIKGIQSILKYRNKWPKQDPLQLGGALVIDKAGQILFAHRSTASSDQPDIKRLLAALP